MNVEREGGQLCQAVGVVTIGAPATPEHVTRQFACDVEAIEAQGSAQVSLDDVSVELEHDRQHIKDSENCDAEPRKLEVLQKYVTLKGDLSAQERQRLLEIADRCPVHQTLHGDLAIRTELKD